jgi:uncharacterized protein (TIGR02453 family)
MPARFPGFPEEAREFLSQLKAHNTREWFQPRKQIYEEKIKAPMVELVLALGEAFREIAPEFDTEPKKAIYRIYRDVRFSHDKRPYKTHVAATFGPRGLSKHAGAGTYFHFSDNEVLVAGGIYAPGPQELLAVRQHLAANAKEFRRITSDRGFRKMFGGVEGEKLKRVPKGFATDHPEADLLVFKQFLVAASLPPKVVETPKLQKEIMKRFAEMLPFLRFLNRPLKPARGMQSMGLPKRPRRR